MKQKSNARLSRFKKTFAPVTLSALLAFTALFPTACTEAELDDWISLALDWLSSSEGLLATSFGVDQDAGTDEGNDALEAAKDIKAMVESSRLRDEAQVLEETGNYQGAMEKYNEAVQTAPKDPQAWEARGRFLDSMGQYEDAVKDYAEAIKKNKDRGITSTGDLYQARAAALLHAGRPKDALADIDRAEEAYEEAGERIPEHLQKDREVAQAHIQKNELVAAGLINQDGTINEEIFNEEWRKYSDFDDRIPIQSRSHEAQQWEATAREKADLMLEFFLLERDQEIEAQLRQEARAYQQALQRNEKQNVIKAFIRMSLLTYTTIKGTPGLGSGAVGLGKSYSKLFTGTGNLLTTGEGLQQLGHLLNVINGLTPSDAPYAFNSKQLSGQVGSAGASVAIETIQELGNPVNVGTKIVQETAKLIVPTDFALSQDELDILKQQHDQLGQINEALDASYDAARQRQARMDGITSQIGRLDGQLTQWEKSEKERVALSLTSTYEKALQ